MLQAMCAHVCVVSINLSSIIYPAGWMVSSEVSWFGLVGFLSFLLSPIVHVLYTHTYIHYARRV
ncbi:hypothetical protein QBC44DRAFT_327793 [Cladorrhinum sp. PSN332]|nr:hypothetical protein QBC44DRAFT_327793 [Cladorrhinum sp. PSN332]